MKKLFVFALVTLTLFAGCRHPKPDDHAPLLSDLMMGKWVNTKVDDKLVLTDDAFVLQFRNHQIHVFSDGYVIDEENKTWTENDHYKYSVSDKVITIHETSNNEESKYIELLVSKVSQNAITYNVQKYICNGVEIVDHKKYDIERITSDISGALLGVWKGKEVSGGSKSNNDSYWEFLSNGTYNFYYFNEAVNAYVKKENHDGHYYLYGNLLATTFKTDVTEKLSYECWNIECSNNSMSWTGLREGGITKKFSMQRTDNPPIIDYKQAILGKWVNTKVNGHQVVSNNAFTVDFQPTYVAMYAKGFALDNLNTKWIENNHYVYAVNNNIVAVEGVDALGVNVSFEMVIRSISQEEMTYSIQKMTINGVATTDNNIYLLKRPTINYSTDILGVWKGKETTPGTHQTYDDFLNFFDDGRCFYYFMNTETGMYHKIDNGHYFLYGDFFVANYDLDPDVTKGQEYGCWNITINNNRLEFVRLRSDGVLQSFLFEKTAYPPIVK